MEKSKWESVKALFHEATIFLIPIFHFPIFHFP